MTYVFNPLQNEGLIPLAKPKEVEDIRSKTPPLNPVIGQYWDEIDDDENFVQTWFWNDTYWLSKPYSTHIPFGGANNYNGVTQGQPFYTLSYNLYLIKYTSCFYSNSDLNEIDYWRLSFNSNFSTLNTLDIKSGNDNETISFVTKTSPLINLHCVPPTSGYLNFQYFKINNAPSIGSPTVIVEYCLARPSI